jgi:hypothetical protein
MKRMADQYMQCASILQDDAALNTSKIQFVLGMFTKVQ